MELSQQLQAGLDGVPSFDGQGHGDLPGRDDAFHIRSGPGQLDQVRVVLDGLHHGFQQHSSLAGRQPRFPVEEVLDEEGDGLNIHTALLGTRKVHVSGWEAVADVQPFVENPVGQVVVAIPDQSFVVEGGGGCIEGPEVSRDLEGGAAASLKSKSQKRRMPTMTTAKRSRGRSRLMEMAPLRRAGS